MQKLFRVIPKDKVRKAFSTNIAGLNKPTNINEQINKGILPFFHLDFPISAMNKDHLHHQRDLEQVAKNIPKNDPNDDASYPITLVTSFLSQIPLFVLNALYFLEGHTWMFNGEIYYASLLLAFYSGVQIGNEFNKPRAQQTIAPILTAIPGFLMAVYALVQMNAMSIGYLSIGFLYLIAYEFIATNMGLLSINHSKTARFNYILLILSLILIFTMQGEREERKQSQLAKNNK
jgi:hypothetical protein